MWRPSALDFCPLAHSQATSSWPPNYPRCTGHKVVPSTRVVDSSRFPESVDTSIWLILPVRASR